MDEKSAFSSNQLANEYLTFTLGSETYGVDLLKVQEIIGIMDVTRVPGTVPALRGVINLRGKVIPVLDLRVKFGLEKVQDNERTCIIVVQVPFQDTVVTLSGIVDEVSEVISLDADKIEPPPHFGIGCDSTFIPGMGKLHEKVVLLLDIDRVMLGDPLALRSGAQYR